MRDLEAKKKYQKEYYLKNKEVLLAYRKNHYLNNKDSYHTRLRKWYKENPEARKKIIRKNVYGITPEQYNEMFEKQKGCCFACNIHHTALKRGLLIDHCHTTGKVRGLLCDGCNKALGCVKDNSEILLNLITYLNNA